MLDILARIDAAVAALPPGPEREALRATRDQNMAIVRDPAEQNGCRVNEVMEYLRALRRVRR